MHLRAFVNISLFSNGENTDGRIAWLNWLVVAIEIANIVRLWHFVI
jgi:hypothetical protein